jgi:hypothetical protein
MSSELYEKFMALHTRDGGLVLPNAWDGLSALMLADAGFEAIATSSVALAATLGRPDGRHEVTRDEHLEHAGLLGRLTGLPSTATSRTGTAKRPRTSRRRSKQLSSAAWPVSVSRTPRAIRNDRSATSTKPSNVYVARSRRPKDGSSSPAVPTTSSRAAQISATPSGV